MYLPEAEQATMSFSDFQARIRRERVQQIIDANKFTRELIESGYCISCAIAPAERSHLQCESCWEDTKHTNRAMYSLKARASRVNS